MVPVLFMLLLTMSAGVETVDVGPNPRAGGLL
jgi:hypothetical protein